MKINLVLPIILILIITIGAIYLSKQPNLLDSIIQKPSPKACTQEALQCPDGSFVGRSGPECEFAKCPAISEEKITTFTQCREIGYEIRGTDPRFCVTPSGRYIREEEEDKLFSTPRPTENPESICKNLCGDGICQEVVCLGSGCPCPESKQSCSRDCR